MCVCVFVCQGWSLSQHPQIYLQKWVFDRCKVQSFIGIYIGYVYLCQQNLLWSTKASQEYSAYNYAYLLNDTAVQISRFTHWCYSQQIGIGCTFGLMSSHWTACEIDLLFIQLLQNSSRYYQLTWSSMSTSQSTFTNTHSISSSHRRTLGY